jgi:pyridoxal biosynthesis lyase PdxS
MIEIDEEQESEVALPFPLLVGLSDQDCVQIIAKAAEIVEARGGQGVDNVVQAMTRVQKEIRWDIAREKKEKEKQITIDAYFQSI